MNIANINKKLLQFKPIIWFSLRAIRTTVFKEDLKKMTEMLNIKYHLYNDEVPMVQNIRLIDGETDKFLGFVDTRKAL